MARLGLDVAHNHANAGSIPVAAISLKSSTLEKTVSAASHQAEPVESHKSRQRSMRVAAGHRVSPHDAI